MRGGVYNEEEEKQYISSLNPDARGSVATDRAPLMESGDVSISYIAGTIEMDDRPRLKKLLFRATRGKALTYFREYE